MSDTKNEQETMQLLEALKCNERFMALRVEEKEHQVKSSVRMTLPSKPSSDGIVPFDYLATDMTAKRVVAGRCLAFLLEVPQVNRLCLAEARVPNHQSS
jgi:hypothetical protein